MFEDMNPIEGSSSVFLKMRELSPHGVTCDGCVGQEVLEGKFLEDENLNNKHRLHAANLVWGLFKKISLHSDFGMLKQCLHDAKSIQMEVENSAASTCFICTDVLWKQPAQISGAWKSCRARSQRGEILPIYV